MSNSHAFVLTYSIILRNRTSCLDEPSNISIVSHSCNTCTVAGNIYIFLFFFILVEITTYVHVIIIWNLRVGSNVCHQSKEHMPSELAISFLELHDRGPSIVTSRHIDGLNIFRIIVQELWLLASNIQRVPDIIKFKLPVSKRLLIIIDF